jgi:hypothetical protein
MFAFLEKQFDLTRSEELRTPLSSMSLLPGGETAYPALWRDWLCAVDAALSGGAHVNMELR